MRKVRDSKVKVVIEPEHLKEVKGMIETVLEANIWEGSEVKDRGLVLDSRFFNRISN